jgi:choline-sulfatase
MSNHPHILKICADQFSPRVWGPGGDPHIRTPNLDALAASGTVFANHYASCPICVPGRFSMLTGRTPSELNAPYFEDILPSGADTYMRRFSQHGYQTTCVGKMHFHGEEQMHGWNFRPYGDMQLFQQKYISGYNTEKDVTGGSPERPIRIGEEESYNAWMVRRAGPGDTGNVRFDRSVTRESIENLTDYFTPSFIDEVYQGERPLLFEASYKSPHCPFVCPQDLFDYYMDVLPPPLHPEPLADNPDFVANMARNDLDDTITPEMIRRARAAFWGLTEWLDGEVGKLLSHLEDLRVRDQFVIQFTADHGEMIGENGLWQKHLPHEQSARVPFLLSGPGIPEGKTVTENTSHVDLYPTLCDLAGLPYPHLGDHPWSGRSMLPLMTDSTPSESRTVISEFRAPDGNHRAEGVPGGIWWVMAKQGSIKLVDYGPDSLDVTDHRHNPQQAFDLAKDPEERFALSLENPLVCTLNTHIKNYRASMRSDQ